MTASTPTLIVPVESQVRELDAKLLLACAAAERGFRVFIGSRAYLHYRLASMDHGIYVAKSMRSLSRVVFSLLRNLGHEIVAFDEEGLVRLPREEYYQRRLDPEVVRRVSHLFTWGEDDAEVFRDFPASSRTPIHVTGNPRIDLMRPEIRHLFDDEVAALAASHGKFILVNTNFGYVNAFVPSLNLMQPAAQPGGGLVPGENTKGMTPEVARGLAAHKQALFDHFRTLVPKLARAFPDHRIVVRPHPSEGHDAWWKATEGLDNVDVIHEGNVVPWLIASSALVHNGCTTAVEAAVLGVPAIAYRPVMSKAFDLDLPNSLSQELSDDDAVIACVAAQIARSDEAALNAEQRAILDWHLSALTGPLAVDRMLDALVVAGYLERIPERGPLLRYAQAWLKSWVRFAAKRVRSLRPGNRNSKSFHTHRFPGTSVPELEARIKELGAQLGRFEGLRVSQRWDHVYVIEVRS